MKSNTALIVIDIQNDYFKSGGNPLDCPDKASENAKQILEKFRSENSAIVHIQHITTGAGDTVFVADTIGAEIHNDVKPENEEKVIIKHYPNSFRDTELLEHLKKENITDLVICGMMTQMCIDSTVRAAKDFGFNIIVISDACATKNLEVNGETVRAEQVQIAFLAALNYFYATVKTAQQYLNEK
jgi:nicotinamidase-related amidase